MVVNRQERLSLAAAEIARAGSVHLKKMKRDPIVCASFSATKTDETAAHCRGKCRLRFLGA
jgi:hypothetical protein